MRRINKISILAVTALVLVSANVKGQSTGVPATFQRVNNRKYADSVYKKLLVLMEEAKASVLNQFFWQYYPKAESSTTYGTRSFIALDYFQSESQSLLPYNCIWGADYIKDQLDGPFYVYTFSNPDTTDCTILYRSLSIRSIKTGKQMTVHARENSAGFGLNAAAYVFYGDVGGANYCGLENERDELYGMKTGNIDKKYDIQVLFKPDFSAPASLVFELPVHNHNYKIHGT